MFQVLLSRVGPMGLSLPETNTGVGIVGSIVGIVGSQIEENSLRARFICDFCPLTNYCMSG